MKLYDGGEAADARRVRIFLAEKGLDVPSEPADAENPDQAPADQVSADQVSADPARQAPVLILDDGTPIIEPIAICRYFEGLRPEPPLFGRGGREAALVEMWNRRVEHDLYAAVAAMVGHLDPSAERALTQPRAADEAAVVEFLKSLDREMSDRLFIVSDHYTVADITALVAIGLMERARLAIPVEFVNVRRWYSQVSARPSAGA